MLSAEKVMTQEIINFNDKVTDKSANCEERRMDFTYKWNSIWSNILL